MASALEILPGSKREFGRDGRGLGLTVTKTFPSKSMLKPKRGRAVKRSKWMLQMKRVWQSECVSQLLPHLSDP